MTDCERTFVSASADSTVKIWDKRRPNPILTCGVLRGAHRGAVNSVAWSPKNQNMFASASDDRNVMIWDYRRTEYPLYTLKSHTDSVLKVKFHPSHENLLVSSGLDDKILVSNLDKF